MLCSLLTDDRMSRWIFSDRIPNISPPSLHNSDSCPLPIQELVAVWEVKAEYKSRQRGHSIHFLSARRIGSAEHNQRRAYLGQPTSVTPRNETIFISEPSANPLEDTEK